MPKTTQHKIPVKRSWAEPYKIKMVELLKMTTTAQRKKAIAAAIDSVSRLLRSPRYDTRAATAPRVRP